MSVNSPCQVHDLGQEFFRQAHSPMYDTLESDSKKPLYLGCKNSFMLLSGMLSLVNVKTKYGWSEKSFTSLLQVVQEGVAGKEAAKGSDAAGFSGGGAQVGFYGICNSIV